MACPASAHADLGRLLGGRDACQVALPDGKRVVLRALQATRSAALALSTSGLLHPGDVTTLRAPSGEGVWFVQLVVDAVDPRGPVDAICVVVADALRLEDERTFERSACEVAVEVRDDAGRSLAGSLVDLSPIGLRFGSAWRGLPGAPLQLALDAGDEPPVVLGVQVVRCERDEQVGWITAAAIRDMSAADWPRLERLAARSHA